MGKLSLDLSEVPVKTNLLKYTILLYIYCSRLTLHFTTWSLFFHPEATNNKSRVETVATFEKRAAPSEEGKRKFFVGKVFGEFHGT